MSSCKKGCIKIGGSKQPIGHFPFIQSFIYCQPVSISRKEFIWHFTVFCCANLFLNITHQFRQRKYMKFISFVGTIALFLIILLIFHESFCHGRVYRVKSNISHKFLNKAKICKAHSNPSLHVLMDRVCYLCHEMFSHLMPNLRAECSEKCYKNAKFRNCLNIFSVLPPSTDAEHPVDKEFKKLFIGIGGENDGGGGEDESNSAGGITYTNE